MIGGKVEAIAHQTNSRLITVIDGKDICRVRIKNSLGAHCIKPGDDVWWQAGKVIGLQQKVILLAKL